MTVPFGLCFRWRYCIGSFWSLFSMEVLYWLVQS